MKKGNMVHLHNGVLFGCKTKQKEKNDIMKYTGQWMKIGKNNHPE